MRLKDEGRLDEAIAAYRQAIVLEPDASNVLASIIYTLHFHPGYDAQAIVHEQRPMEPTICGAAEEVHPAARQ